MHIKILVIIKYITVPFECINVPHVSYLMLKMIHIPSNYKYHYFSVVVSSTSNLREAGSNQLATLNILELYEPSRLE